MARKLIRKPDAKERLAIAKTMKDSFDLLATHRGTAFIYAVVADQNDGAKLLRALGDSIYKFLAPVGDDQLAAADQHVAALETIHRLLKGNATALDLVDFMFDCTCGVPSTVTGYLEQAGFSKNKLKTMATACNGLAGELEKLNREAIPGPLSYLFHVGKLSPDHKTLTAFELLPEHLRICAAVLEHWPPGDFTASLSQRQSGKRYLTAYFAFYLTLCGGKTFEDMSALFRLMRSAWLDVFPKAQAKTPGLRKAALQHYPFLQFAEKNQRDPLSPQSLRAAVDRFFELNPDARYDAITHVGQYLKDPKYKALQQQHETFLSLLPYF